MGPKAIKFFESYFEDRKQYVINQLKKSTYSEVTTGLLQGDILSPLLFSIMVDDLLELDCGGKIFMFADDTTILFY